jgi:hypothetical protein
VEFELVLIWFAVCGGGGGDEVSLLCASGEGGMVEGLNGIVAYVYSRFGRLGWMVFKD